jgi:hypothetical protein
MFFLAAAVFVLACQTGAFVQVGFWSIAATVLLVAVFISSLIDFNIFGIFLPLALLYLIYQKPLQLPQVSFWTLLLAAALADIGFSMIFHPHRHHHWEDWDRHGHCGDWDSGTSVERIEGNDVFVKTSFSESCKYLHSDSLKSAHLASSFGKLSVYFDQVLLSPEGAEAFLDVSFGSMSLYLPKEWRVEDRIHTGAGSVNSDHRREAPDAGAPVLTLTGNVSFGSLDIHYV